MGRATDSPLLCLSPAPVPPTFRQAPRIPQDRLLVKAGDKAVLSCEADSLPEPAVTWYKDRQPLVPAQRTQILQGGQRLEILDTQVSNPVVWAAMGGHAMSPPGPGGHGMGAAAASACKTPSPGGE